MNAKRVWMFLAHVPALVVAWANGLFVWNHFYARAPYFFDAGWFSATVFRAGFFARNPHPGMPYYWGWHPSLLVSVGSLLSYAFPGDRVTWYCVFQAMVYAPFALAVPLLVPKSERRGVASATFTAACSLAFAFGGQIVAAIAYPHFELFASAGTSIMLAALAMGRERIAWAGLVMAIATREDGGFHAASFLGAVLAADFTGRVFPIARRRVMTMFAVAIVATGVLVIIQKKLFVSVDAWSLYLAGNPPYAHLTKELLVTRLGYLFARGGFIWCPFVATLAIAVLRRDARYLLGWLATLPWFVLNVCALQDVKGEISTYTGFPFVTSAFWAAAYARACDRGPVVSGWRWPLVVAGSLGAISLVGLHAGNPAATRAALHGAFVPSAENTSGLERFEKELRARQHGKVFMDLATKSWALEVGMAEQDAMPIAEADAYAFFVGEHVPDVLAGTSFTKCGRVAPTLAFFCTRPDRALPEGLVPSSPMVALASIDPKGARRDGETIVIEPGPVAAQVFGPYARFRPGHYEARWDVSIDRCGHAPTPKVHFDVLRTSKGVVAEHDAAPDEGTFVIAFDVPSDARDDGWELRTFSGPCAVRVEDVTMRRILP